MSKEFVRGLNRPSMPKPEVPDGYRKVKYHGNVNGGRSWPLPWPVESRHSANGGTFKVDAEGIGLMDDETWAWTRTNCPEAFTEVEAKPVEVADE